ncbi:hypothetical protein B0H14DRAFT_3451136 [Mycena olivaceomarginata]|nr:hypothetical protein B0H14DRAFT_3451136 [Mycena olivaceomarginata]
MLGHKYVHIYEKWSWIPTAITSFVVLGFSAKHLVNVLIGTGPAEASNVLSLRASSSASRSGGCPSRATTACTSPWKMFSWTYGLQSGLIVPLVLIQFARRRTLQRRLDRRKGDWASYEAAQTWNQQDWTPVGVAAVTAFSFDALWTAMGMAQVG